mmetsp:Transcript_9688/g.23851  ORF Transcript_9688/g.23851 Transcript_9688/m.23851 type:complete len:393 (+) Transcript_9688:112-1290(+)|eukprot:CAMPEP_0178982852 /NCGR_PEP_ID=MMETSP0795-20121207/727_1 /TAXON_ID=88552 /ORGANISM="Amoebophrya sp., Strain Ameob2" /LENGTH=392 /DNA_ID=CAMNT_0020673545 /DNA_START=364 /DNA_END=1542 /DNA_ORIENTATION=+
MFASSSTPSAWRVFAHFLLALLLQVTGPAPLFAAAKECEAKPGEIPQLSDKVQCDCCEPPKAYLRKHKYVYVLFYAGAHPNKINADIFQKYTAFFEEWKHTNVAFGKVDIDMDKQFSDEWLEPNQIPTNILFKDGEPIVVAKEDFQKALSLYQGSPEGHRVLLDKYFGGGLHYTKVLDTAGKLKKFLKNKEPVGIPLKIVGVFPGFKDDHSLVKGFRAGVWKQGHNMLGWRSDQLYSEDKYQQAGFALVTDVEVAKKFIYSIPAFEGKGWKSIFARSEAEEQTCNEYQAGWVVTLTWDMNNDAKKEWQKTAWRRFPIGSETADFMDYMAGEKKLPKPVTEEELDAMDDEDSPNDKKSDDDAPKKPKEKQKKKKGKAKKAKSPVEESAVDVEL